MKEREYAVPFPWFAQQYTLDLKTEIVYTSAVAPFMGA